MIDYQVIWTALGVIVTMLGAFGVYLKSRDSRIKKDVTTDITLHEIKITMNDVRDDVKLLGGIKDTVTKLCGEMSTVRGIAEKAHTRMDEHLGIKNGGEHNEVR